VTAKSDPLDWLGTAVGRDDQIPDGELLDFPLAQDGEDVRAHEITRHITTPMMVMMVLPGRGATDARQHRACHYPAHCQQAASRAPPGTPFDDLLGHGSTALRVRLPGTRRKCAWAATWRTLLNFREAAMTPRPEEYCGTGRVPTISSPARTRSMGSGGQPAFASGHPACNRGGQVVRRSPRRP